VNNQNSGLIFGPPCTDKILTKADTAVQELTDSASRNSNIYAA